MDKTEEKCLFHGGICTGCGEDRFTFAVPIPDRKTYANAEGALRATVLERIHYTGESRYCPLTEETVGCCVYQHRTAGTGRSLDTRKTDTYESPEDFRKGWKTVITRKVSESKFNKMLIADLKGEYIVETDQKDINEQRWTTFSCWRWTGTEASEVPVTKGDLYHDGIRFHLSDGDRRRAYPTKRECEAANRVTVVEFRDTVNHTDGPEPLPEKPRGSWYGKAERLLRSMTDEVLAFVRTQPGSALTLEYPVCLHIEDENGDIHILKAGTARCNPWRNTLELFGDGFDMERLAAEDESQQWKRHTTPEEFWETCEPPMTDLTSSYTAVRTEDLILLADAILNLQ